MAAERVLQIGKVVGLHGVQGWVKLESYTEPRIKIFDYQPWLIESGGNQSEVDKVHGREQGKGLIGKLSGIDDRDAAATLVGASIKILRSQLPRSAPGQFYWTDLEGLDVVTIDGVSLGKVSHLFSTGSNDVIVARDGTKERLIPYVQDQFVKSIDLDNARITVDWDPEF